MSENPSVLKITTYLDFQSKKQVARKLEARGIEEGILETKTDCSAKDLLFLACIGFCVITFEPIMIKTCSAPQNDRLIFSFVKHIEVVVGKMTRNRHKTIEKTADSLLCPFHSIQFSPLVCVYIRVFFYRFFRLLGHTTCQYNISNIRY